LLPTSEPKFQGATVNPWDPRLSAGGSSGGTAAAVAAGLVPVAHAGGFIRTSDPTCGVSGLEPTRAGTPLGAGVGYLARRSRTPGAPPPCGAAPAAPTPSDQTFLPELTATPQEVAGRASR
jgi:Asp-tRNA(Asn)/Glu-tRNA(Gln) amidotransferase A subunit family amidase